MPKIVPKVIDTSALGRRGKIHADRLLAGQGTGGIDGVFWRSCHNDCDEWAHEALTAVETRHPTANCGKTNCKAQNDWCVWAVATLCVVMTVMRSIINKFNFKSEHRVASCQKFGGQRSIDNSSSQNAMLLVKSSHFNFDITQNVDRVKKPDPPPPNSTHLLVGRESRRLLIGDFLQKISTGR